MTNHVESMEINSGGGWVQSMIQRDSIKWRYLPDANDLPQDMYDTLKTWLEGRK